MKSTYPILIIGNTPPPIGGVTIHVARLLKILKEKKINFHFFELSAKKLPLLFFKIWKYRIIHLQTSNSYLRFILILWCKLFFKKTIFTFHGNVGRYNKLRNWCDRSSFKLATVPIVINKNSFKLASSFSSQVKQISAFIPEKEPKILSKVIEKKLLALKKNYAQLFSTNASALSFDRENKEIYQVSTLIEIFSVLNDKALVISDPTGKNFHKFQDKLMNCENILFITEDHDFNSVLKLSDCFIRYTTTDGDALSVNEAIYWGKNVIASNVVDRPLGVELVDLNTESLFEAIRHFESSELKTNVNESITELLQLYNNLGVKS